MTDNFGSGSQANKRNISSTTLRRAEIGDPVTACAATKQLQEEDEVEKREAVQEYKPTKPSMTLPVTELLAKIAAHAKIKAERDGTVKYTHQPFLMQHMLAGAPYTHALCRRCTPRRKCESHSAREVFRQQTSVSLCPHTRLILYWAINDPNNDNGSWKLEVNEYFGSRNWVLKGKQGWDCYEPVAEDEEQRERVDHGLCEVDKEEFRVALLAERVVEDFRRERKALRGSERRVRKEIHALLGALKRAEVVKQERLSEQMEARNNIAKMLRKLAQETRTKTRLSVEDSEVVETVEKTEGVQIEVHIASDEVLVKTTTPEIALAETEEEVVPKTHRCIALELETTQSLTVQTSFPSPSPTPSTHRSSSPSMNGTPIPESIPSSSPVYKRKRSRTASPATSGAAMERPVKKMKKSVRWAENTDTYPGQRTRIISPVYVPVAI